MLLTVRDRDDVVREVHLETRGALCGSGYDAETTGTEVVTCLACLHFVPENGCGCGDAVVRNCPMAYDRGGPFQRCLCCGDCAYECARDI